MNLPALRRRLHGADETEALGRALGAELWPGDLLALRGELGAGKTTLVRGIAAGMGIDPAQVRSPTFVLHHVYSRDGAMLHHLDAYRLGAGTDLRREVDLEGLLDEGVVVVEWAEFVPVDDLNAITVRLEVDAPDVRTAALDASAPERVRVAFQAEVAAS
jgi:tRNA threonylcarbamoyladenosine biosynthesis protein TsaE